MQEQTVLFDPDKNTFCVLNESAAVLWDLLETPITVDDLSEGLAASFDTPEGESVREHVDSTLAELTELDLVAQES